MIDEGIRAAICALADQHRGLREISRLVHVSRNTVRRVLRGERRRAARASSIDPDTVALIESLFERCKGNVVRVHEMLRDDYQRTIAYTTLVRYVRQAGLRPAKTRTGTYTFAAGEEMQHDTSPIRIALADQVVEAQCAALTLAFSRRLYFQFMPRFTRFEAKCFLSEALQFMDGSAARCIIDNTSVIVAEGSGPDAVMAPEMVAFGNAFGFHFVAHRINDPNRKARIERPFHYIQNNFLVGRDFRDWSDLNAKALDWNHETANAKPKRSLGMSPEAAYLIEKPSLKPLPSALPPVYESHVRTVDTHGDVNLDTNRYSVPERLIGRKVTVLKHAGTVAIYYDHDLIAEHPRLIGQRNKRSTLPGHHAPLHSSRSRPQPAPEERLLLGHHSVLDEYVAALKRRAPGRGVRRLQRLLNLKRQYPPEAYYAAVEQALRYGLFDLNRLEQMILERVAGDIFNLDDVD